MATTERDIRRLAGVHPKLISIIVNIFCIMPMFVVEGLRTAERQHALYLIGRDPRYPGKIVTDKDGYILKSAHQAHTDGLGYAVDCAFTGSDPFAPTHDWKRFGTAVEAAGLIWGGRFPRLVDLDHAELIDVAK